MIIVNLKGGLGNQMFQYALGYSLANMNNTNLEFDLRYLKEREIESKKDYVIRKFDLDIFGIESKEASQRSLMKVGMFFGTYRLRYIFAKILDRISPLVMSERFIGFEARILNNRAKNIYLDGYWQTEKYFSAHASDIRKIFTFNKSKIDPHIINLAQTIKFKKNAVCLNVRRSDFLGSKEHEVINIDYYTRGLEILKKKYSYNLHIFIFSDDIRWCRQKLQNISDEVTVVGHEYAGEKFSSYLYLMTQFRMFIIPNSTFAWWAAWLASDQDKIVIAPKIWSRSQREEVSIIPLNSWICI